MFYSVYVGQLPVKSTKEDLLELFSQHEPKEAVVLYKDDCKSSAYGFVRFLQPQAVVDVVKEGDWTLRGKMLSVDVASETKQVLRNLMTSRHPSSKMVERDNTVRAKVKEATRQINQQLDIISGEVPMDAQWVINNMEKCPTRYAPKLTGNPRSSNHFELEHLRRYLEHSEPSEEQQPWSSREPGTDVADQGRMRQNTDLQGRTPEGQRPNSVFRSAGFEQGLTPEGQPRFRGGWRPHPKIRLDVSGLKSQSGDGGSSQPKSTHEAVMDGVKALLSEIHGLLECSFHREGQLEAEALSSLGECPQQPLSERKFYIPKNLKKVMDSLEMPCGDQALRARIQAAQDGFVTSHSQQQLQSDLDKPLPANIERLLQESIAKRLQMGLYSGGEFSLKGFGETGPGGPVEVLTNQPHSELGLRGRHRSVDPPGAPNSHHRDPERAQYSQHNSQLRNQLKTCLPLANSPNACPSSSGTAPASRLLLSLHRANAVTPQNNIETIDKGARFSSKGGMDDLSGKSSEKVRERQRWLMELRKMNQGRGRGMGDRHKGEDDSLPSHKNPVFVVPDSCKAAFESEDTGDLADMEDAWAELGRANFHLLHSHREMEEEISDCYARQRPAMIRRPAGKKSLASKGSGNPASREPPMNYRLKDRVNDDNDDYYEDDRNSLSDSGVKSSSDSDSEGPPPSAPSPQPSYVAAALRAGRGRGASLPAMMNALQMSGKKKTEDGEDGGAGGVRGIEGSQPRHGAVVGGRGRGKGLTLLQ